MSLLQLWSIAAVAVVLKAGVVALLILTGAPVLTLLAGGYAIAVVFMLGMQRRARECCDSRNYRRHRLPELRSIESSSAGRFGGVAELPVGMPSHMHA